ncbi:hypothetical protein PRZ48_004767 [Zasmidium cellare]|uniref:DNA-directed RNA polymerase III subunit RPC9 n=1 Tax=Zasmidium cellare TaxID=395010 RepID=A0ABR0EQF2_ZASCE|nr:hypothetical protein PRZ48_004767 [Zasmidium cellare]
MKILDAGDHMLSNADVLDWMARKRAQHAKEDAEDKKKGVKPAPRPSNFMRALTRHERELKSDNYPYVKNPSAYEGQARHDTVEKFGLEAENVVMNHLEAEWKDRLATMPKDELEKVFAPEQEKKTLTQPELLMIYNNAPTCTEMLQPMIENVEERFTVEEQQLLVDAVMNDRLLDAVGAETDSRAETPTLTTAPTPAAASAASSATAPTAAPVAASTAVPATTAVTAPVTDQHNVAERFENLRPSSSSSNLPSSDLPSSPPEPQAKPMASQCSQI